MAFTQPIIEVLRQNQDWRTVKFWTTHDGRHCCANDMTSEHLINICRQIVNAACIESGIDPVPIKRVQAYINFPIADPIEWVTLCRLFYDEINARARRTRIENKRSNPMIGYMQNIFDPGYDRIFDEIKIRIDLLAKRYLPDSQTRIDENVKPALIS